MSLSTFAEPIATAPVTSLKLPAVATVSVIIPCYNEERFIGKALENLAGQYVAENYEVVVVDGMSNDGTREVIRRFQEAYPEIAVRLVENLARNIPRALNLGIDAARGEIIARIDAHTAPSPGYIRRCVEVLTAGEAEVVGMPCRVQPGGDTAIARAIAIAVSHPFGIGDARYRLSDGRMTQEPVDTVAFACFRKSLWSEIGGYDEKLLTNEDYDFNYRVRMRGERVILDRRAHCDYFARATMPKLAAQYFRYGAWKARMIRQRPRSVKVRHLVAPMFVASIILLAALGFWRKPIWSVLAVELAVYFTAALVFALRAKRKSQAEFRVMLMMPLVFFAIHFSWGMSFLVGLIRPPR
jgi:succinoglycan biosynthesis protein ExoA